MSVLSLIKSMIIVMCGGLFLSGCASSLKDVKVEKVQLCEHKQCATLGSGIDADSFVSRIYAFLSRRINQDAKLTEAEPQTRELTSDSIKYFTQGGPLPFFTTLYSVKFTDVSYLDREKKEIRFKLRPWSSFLGVPVLCAEGEGTLTVRSPQDVQLETSSFCTWLVVGTVSWEMKLKLDHIDLDKATFAGYYSTGHAGPASGGKGSGYQVATFGGQLSPAQDTPISASASQQPSMQPAQPIKPKSVPVSVAAKPIEVVKVSSQTPKLQFKLELKDQNSNRVLEGGEEVVLVVEVVNQGEGTAEDVQLHFSGTQSLLTLFGPKQPVGNLVSGAGKRIELKGVLPTNVSSENAELKVGLSERHGFAPSEARVVRVATRGVEIREVVEVVSDLNVDDIPAKVSGYVKPEDVAVVIGIGAYREASLPAVKYARRDAEVVAKYLENLSGIPKANIALLTDANATKSDIEAYLEDWLPRRVNANSRVYLYYAGHGAPEPDGTKAYIVPYDGHPDFTSKLIPLARIQEALNRLKARESVVLLDSCFSGASGRSVMQSGIRPLVLSGQRQLAAGEKSVVVASASGSEVTSDFDQARHGLFTYYLLKGLRGEADRNGNGRVTLGELFAFVSSNVTMTASRELNRTQTPVMLAPSDAKFSGLEITRTR